MPPSNDEYRTEALGAMILLVAQLERSHDRTSTLAIAREIRAVLARADKVLKQPGDTDELHEMADAARGPVIKSYGMSAWGWPETVADGTPLTEDELERLFESACEIIEAINLAQPEDLFAARAARTEAENLLRLVAQVRRLHSDPCTFMPMLTAKELETIDALIQVAIPMTDGKSDKAPPKAFARLISDYRRLLSDQWLQAAAVEAISGGELARLQRDAMIDILRKHRDGKAD